jgi:hypothetical protein
VDRLTAKVGDLDLEKQHLADELAETRAELDQVRRSLNQSAMALPEPATLLSTVRNQLGKKSKATLQDVEAILEILA